MYIFIIVSLMVKQLTSCKYYYKIFMNIIIITWPGNYEADISALGPRRVKTLNV